MKSVSVGFLCLIIVAAAALTGAGSVQAAMIEQQATVSVNIGINYGAGPVEWHNGTVVPSGENLLNATMKVATVEFMSFPGLGAFVTGINGKSQNPAANLYWTYWVYSPQTHQYEMPLVGASAYTLTSDQTIQWYYENAGSLTNPALRPYTSVSLGVHLDTSTDPPTAVISGAISPAPGGPTNVTLEFSNDQGGTYKEMARITSAPDGTFSYSWKLPTGGMFMTRANAQGAQSSPVSFGTSGSVPGFPLESLFAGAILGLLIGVARRKRRLYNPADKRP